MKRTNAICRQNAVTSIINKWISKAKSNRVLLTQWFPIQFFFLKQQPISGLGRLLAELSRLHTIRNTPIELFWMSDQRVTETVTYTTYNGHKWQTAMPSVGFEQAIPAIKRLQFRALNRPPKAASHKVSGREIDGWWFLCNCIWWEFEINC